MDELVSEFLAEVTKALEMLGGDLAILEKNSANLKPDDMDIIGNISAVMRTIKGTCGFLGLGRLESLAQAVENLLEKIKSGQQPVTPYVASLILESVGKIKDIIKTLKEEEAEPEGDDSGLIARLDTCHKVSFKAPVRAKDGSKRSGVGISAKEIERAIAKGLEAYDKALVEKVETALPAPIMGSTSVSTAILEKLMKSAADLALTRNQLLQSSRKNSDGNADFNMYLKRLNHVTADLLDGVMQTRMRPIAEIREDLQRIVKDMALDSGRNITFEMTGGDTGIDADTLPAIKEAVADMVRNMALENPAGKTASCTIRLHAFQQGGYVVIRIADDSGGINFNARNVPSVSTFGMDTVVKNIKKLGGNLSLDYKAGQGCFLTVKIPLTLAFMPVLTVASAGERFAIPQGQIAEIVCPQEEAGEDISSDKIIDLRNHVAKIWENNGIEETKAACAIEDLNGAPVLRLREDLLSLVNLSALLKHKETAASKGKYVVVCELGSRKFGIMVDKVMDSEEVAIKPLSPFLRHLEFYSGMSVLGDGSVIMVLDTDVVAKTMAGLADVKKKKLIDNESITSGKSTNFLKFYSGGKASRLVPLAQLSRLEGLDMSKAKWSGKKRVMQYGSGLLHLISIDDAAIPEDGIAEVMVFIKQGKMLGLVADAVMGIVTGKLEVQNKTAGAAGVLGSLVINGEESDLVDIEHYFATTFTGWQPDGAEFPENRGKNILLVDDSPFFRKFMKPILVVAGYNVTTAEDAFQAQEILHQNEVSFDAVITDIDMPGMTGIEFVKKCKEEERFRLLPFVALTAYSGEKVEAGAGQFSGYVSKSERNKLIEEINMVLGSVEEAV